MPAEDFLALKQYSLSKKEKQELLLPELLALHAYHYKASAEYKAISDKIFPGAIHNAYDLPYLPVTAFKEHALKSIPDADVFKTLTSSGTTGSVPSRIFLDKQTAQLQTAALSSIMQYILGKERLPMLIADTIGLIKNRTSFSARAAGVLGMSVFGKSHTYLLDEEMKVNAELLQQFLEKHKGKPMLIFGFTFMVWEYLYEQNIEADLSNAILVHSGGWKKLIEKQIDNKTFKELLHKKFGLNRIYNFYGMVEQVGSVFTECEQGYLHAPNFADIIVRSPYDFSVLPEGEKGLIQAVSILPRSYPGFSLLTEDLGIIHGEDTCTCGRKGKFFEIKGRMPKAELRGCSDTFAETKRA